MTKEYVKESIRLENEQFCLMIGSDCVPCSLVHKATGQECLAAGEKIALFSLTEERPYNNEIKVAHPNKRTTFQANRVRMEGDKLIVGFELVTFEAVVEVKIAPGYMGFTLVDFIIRPSDFGNLAITPPPVYEFRVLQLPVKDRTYFGEWLNVVWDETVAVNVLATSPYTRIEADPRKGYRILSGDTLRDIRLKGCGAALIVSSAQEFLDAVEAVEEDYDLPRGVRSRRGSQINASVYWSADVNPENVEEHIAYALQGGFRMMLINYCALFQEAGWYSYCGNYDFRPEYPEGIEDLKKMLARIKEAGITPGFHFLHPHIGVKSRYVKPTADHRLHLTRHFTLARPLGTEEDTIYVEENPEGTVIEPRCRVLKFGGELISYEAYRTERPYCFIGCKRGHFETKVRPHELGTIGGILDISAYGADSVYIDQNSGLQDEIGDRLAEIYNAGFEFVYFDGSEGTNSPYEIYIPLAQYRVYRKLQKAPLFCEGAAKAHFSWHMLSGGNAFDIFRPEVFKQKLAEHPLKEAPRMAQDFTRLNFGWWHYFQETQPDQFEYGTSRAAAWDCPITMQESRERFRSNPRTRDNLEIMRRWEDVRARGLLTPEMKEQLRDPAQEHILLLNENGEYELTAYECIPGAAGGNKAVSVFAFERKGKYSVVCWHTAGSGILSLPVRAEDILYEEEIGGERVDVTPEGDSTLLPLEGRRYVTSQLSKEKLVEAFEQAVLVKMLTLQDVAKAMKDLGVEQGDSVLVHSSFKSLGETENGADTVIRGLQAAVGEEGTVIFPTLCQKDWEHVYENWHLDAESDVGYLTNYFRKLPGTHRSDQASHSVAAMGKDAKWLTQTHGKSGLRYGIFGDSPFSADSPWEKMYHMNTKVLFVGVGIRKCTFRHYAEYCFMEMYLDKAKQGIQRKARQEGWTEEQAESRFAVMKARLWHYDRWSQGGVWPHVDSVYVLEKLEEQGKVHRGKCGDADVIMVSAGDFVDEAYGLLEERDQGVFWVDTKTWDVSMTLDWLKEVDEL